MCKKDCRGWRGAEVWDSMDSWLQSKVRKELVEEEVRAATTFPFSITTRWLNIFIFLFYTRAIRMSISWGKGCIILNGADWIAYVKAELLRMHELDHSLPINTTQQPNLFSDYMTPSFPLKPLKSRWSTVWPHWQWWKAGSVLCLLSSLSSNQLPWDFRDNFIDPANLPIHPSINTEFQEVPFVLLMRFLLPFPLGLLGSILLIIQLVTFHSIPLPQPLTTFQL